MGQGCKFRPDGFDMLGLGQHISAFLYRKTTPATHQGEVDHGPTKTPVGNKPDPASKAATATSIATMIPM